MKPLYAVFTLALFMNTSTYADDAMHNMPGIKDHAMPNATAKTQNVQTHRGQGIVNTVDITAGKLNLTHEPIASLGWKGMTMDFSVKNSDILKNVKPGLKVEFELEKKDRTYLITRMIPLASSVKKSNDHMDNPGHSHTH